MKEKIGKGSFGQVYTCENIVDGSTLICKINDDKTMNEKEAKILKALNDK